MSKIPKTIVQTWETKQLSKEFKKLTIDTWINNNPGYKYILFDATDRLEFIKQNFDNFVVEVYESIVAGAFKADLFRYCYLYINGGITIDIDTVCLGKLDDFICPKHSNKYVEFITAVDLNIDINGDKHNLAGGLIIACEPKHPVIKYCIDRIVNNVRSNIITHSLDFTGPSVLGRCMNIYLGNEEKSSFVGKEGFITAKNGNNIYLLRFERYSEYYKDIYTNRVLGQNKNGNQHVLRLYNKECRMINSYVCWGKCPVNERAILYNKKHIVLMINGQFGNFETNLEKNIKNLEPIFKTHHIHVFVLSDKLESGNYSIENENKIKSVFKEFYFNIHFFDYIENYDNTEELYMCEKFLSNVKNKNMVDTKSVCSVYRRFLLNKIKNSYIVRNNLVIDLTVYCQMFDTEINIFNTYKQTDDIVYMSDKFFVGSQPVIDYLFELANVYKDGKIYDQQLDNKDKNIYSSEIQYMLHIYNSKYTYKDL